MSYQLSERFDLADAELISVIDDLALWSAPFGLKLLEMVRLHPDLRVLDVGAGCGFPGVELSQRLGTSSLVISVDPWREALQRAALKRRLWSIPNFHPIVSRAEMLPLPGGSIDLIVSNNGTNNVDDEERCYAELARVARPGAQMVLSMNLPETMIEWYATLEGILVERGMAAEVARLRAHILEKRKPLEHLERLLDRAGFELHTVHEDAFTLRFLDGTTMLGHFLIRLAFLESWIHLLDPADVEAVFARAEEALNERARREGELGLTVPWVCLECRRRS